MSSPRPGPGGVWGVTPPRSSTFVAFQFQLSNVYSFIVYHTFIQSYERCFLAQIFAFPTFFDSLMVNKIVFGASPLDPGGFYPLQVFTKIFIELHSEFLCYSWDASPDVQCDAFNDINLLGKVGSTPSKEKSGTRPGPP